MPSPLHQTVIDLLRHAPALVPELLALAGAAPGAVSSVRLVDATLDQISRRVDLAVEVEDAAGEPLTVGVEIQLGIKPAKLLSWPVYATTMRSPQCPSACLLIVAPDRRVAEWAARPIRLGPGNESFRVHVIGPDEIPRISEPHVARSHPEMGFLSALAHAHAEPELVRVALAGLDALDSPRARSYGEVLLKTIEKALRGAVKDQLMEDLNNCEDDDDDGVFARRDDADEVTPEFVELALRWGRQLLVQDDRRRAREALREEGRQEGLLLGRREVLTHLLARAGLQPTADEQLSIATCENLATLDRWIDQAISARSVAAALA